MSSIKDVSTLQKVLADILSGWGQDYLALQRATGLSEKRCKEIAVLYTEIIKQQLTTKQKAP
jgi:hypothetical protein